MLSMVPNKLFCALFFILMLLLFYTFTQLKNTHNDRFESKYILDLRDVQGSKLSNFLFSPIRAQGGGEGQNM